MDIPTVTPWTWSAELTPPNRDTVADVAYFRVQTEVEIAWEGPVLLRLTADSRYRLTVNGTFVSAGPAKPSGGVWFVDTVNIADQLRVGTNVIGIEVLSYAVDRTGNASVLRTGSPGLSVSGLLPNGVDLADPKSWRWTQVDGRRFSQGDNTVFLGIQETVDGHTIPHGWLAEGFDDTDWKVTESTAQGAFLDRMERPRTLDRLIPPLTLVPAPFAAVSRRTAEDLDWDALIRGDKVVIGSDRVTEVDLDASILLTAYLDLHLIGGAGAVIELTAAECYEEPPVEIPWQRRKR